MSDAPADVAKVMPTALFYTLGLPALAVLLGVPLAVTFVLYPVHRTTRLIILDWLLLGDDFQIGGHPVVLLPPSPRRASTPTVREIAQHCLGTPLPRRRGRQWRADAADWLRGLELYSPQAFRRDVLFLFPCGQPRPSTSVQALLKSKAMLHAWIDLDRLCRAGRFDSNRTVLPIFFSDEAPPLATPLPVIVKTRLIRSNGSHAVLVPWEMDLYYTSARMRAESFVAWASKRDTLVWRGGTTGNGLRRAFVHGLAHLDTNDVDVKFSAVVQGRPSWVKPRGCASSRAPCATRGPYMGNAMGRRQLLRYRYILSLEGNDIASNLAWLLGHNSLVMMPPPTWENYLLHGRLSPWVHYVPVATPEEVPVALRWARAHEAACQRIIANANGWVEQLLSRDVFWPAATRILEAARVPHALLEAATGPRRTRMFAESPQRRNSTVRKWPRRRRPWRRRRAGAMRSQPASHTVSARFDESVAREMGWPS